MAERALRADAPRLPWLLFVALIVAGLILTLDGLRAAMPFSGWWEALAGRTSDVQSLVFVHVTLPRVAISLLVGAALGLSGVLFQQALSNPLAETATLGVASGAYLALIAASLFAPWLMGWGQEWVALAGGAGAAAIVLCLAWQAGFSTTTVILCGLTISLLCGAAASVLMLMNHDQLGTLFIWQSGSLVQNGWDPTFRTLLCLACCGAVAAVIRRPMQMLSLDDGQARALGAPVRALRWLGVLLAVTLSAVPVSMVGVIGFIGLAAPHLVGLLGARTFAQRLAAAPVAGALLLWLTDQGVQHVRLFTLEIPAGSAAALMGAPLLLLLLARRGAVEPMVVRPAAAHWPARSSGAMTIAVLFCIMAAVAAGLLVGRGPAGWQFLTEQAASHVLPWRLPRVGGALAAGMMLGLAGSMLQRITGNPMASPELLGVSGGAGLGIILLLLTAPQFDRASMMLAGFIGAFVALGALVAFNRTPDPSGNRILLSGVALATAFSAFASVLLTSGDPRVALLLTWMSGSTYRVTAGDAIVAGVIATLAMIAIPFTARWLQILPLGHAVSRSVGLASAAGRLTLLGFVAILTAGATLVIGPISFIGLIAPHMATSLGMRRPVGHALMSAGLGGALLVAADWLGRMILFPWQLPAGLVATLVGGPIFFLLLLRRR